jgi:hypothetical protein
MRVVEHSAKSFSTFVELKIFLTLYSTEIALVAVAIMLETLGSRSGTLGTTPQKAHPVMQLPLQTQKTGRSLRILAAS